MANETYVVWDYEAGAYIADAEVALHTGRQRTRDVLLAHRMKEDQATHLLCAANLPGGRDKFAMSLSPECGGNPTFHLPRRLCFGERGEIMTNKHPTCETCKHWGDHYGGDWPFLTDDGDNPCEVTERDFYCSMHSEVTGG